MEVPVVMPPMGDAAGELIVNRWLKSPGDPLAKGDQLFEVATDKVEVAVEALAGGTLSRIVVQEGQQAEEGQVIAYIDEDRRTGAPQASR